MGTCSTHSDQDAAGVAVGEKIPGTVLLASPRSFCAGVERAIRTVERAVELFPPPVYVRKQIVHNTHVVADLEARGAVFVDELVDVPDGATVVFSAHGVSPAVRSEARRRGLQVIDATCPLVTKVHNEVRRYARRGNQVVLIGHAGHEEVEGTLGEAPDNIVLVQTTADLAAIPVDRKISYVSQTTLAADETADIIDELRRLFPGAGGPPTDDICYATTNRQNAVRSILPDADLVIVVGSANSSNSVRLAEIVKREGVPAHLIDDATEIDPEWLRDVANVGVTAGASTPPRLVEGVIERLHGLGYPTVTHRTAGHEDVQFTLPKGVCES
jgi:4-hydroxy-3-methylbut-2-enyl diphosphate reductase